MEGVIDWLVNLGTHYPDLVVLVLGSLFGMVMTLALEWWALPAVTDPDARRRQKGLTFLFCWFVSAWASAWLWWALDPADAWPIRVTVSTVVGAFGFFGYPPAARILTDRFPSIGSAWDGLHPKD